MTLNVLNLVRRQADVAFSSPVYYAQQRDYNERYSIHEQNARRWRHTSFCSLAIAFAAVCGLVYDGSLSKYMPYVVERDHLGDQIAIGPAERVDPVDPRVIQTDINRWIYDVRTVSPDAQTEKHNIYEAYDHTDRSCPAKGELDEWFSKNTPFKRAVSEIVTTTTVSTLPTPPHQWKTWLAKWKEETRDRSGALTHAELKEMSVTMEHKQPSTDDDFKHNSTGSFVCNFDWKN